MIRYHIRSRDLVGIYNELAAGRLIPDAYFQRNLVWRESHKQDFIKTILLGYPFPQIFISKGKVNIETKQTTSCIVDGQQRLNAISDYIDEKFKVDGKTYGELTDDDKSEFLKYEIAVIELDIENTDPRIKDIFQRINRTSNALTGIEKLASEYAASEFMFTCRIIADDIDIESDDEDDFKIDPVITSNLLSWAKNADLNKIKKLVLDSDIFTQHELTRKVHLQYVLNIVATILTGYYNRNEKIFDLLNDYAQEFPEKDKVLNLLENVAEFYLALKFTKKSMWKKKANFFTLFIELYKSISCKTEPGLEKLQANLNAFEANIPTDYRLAAQDGVNNKKQRQTRSNYVTEIISASI
jgi:hypothetical protein